MNVGWKARLLCLCKSGRACVFFARRMICNLCYVVISVFFYFTNENSFRQMFVQPGAREEWKKNNTYMFIIRCSLLINYTFDCLFVLSRLYLNKKLILHKTESLIVLIVAHIIFFSSRFFFCLIKIYSHFHCEVSKHRIETYRTVFSFCH